MSIHDTKDSDPKEVTTSSVPSDDATILSQQEPSAVIVMGFDEYGKLKNAQKQKNDFSSVNSNHSFGCDQIETPLGVTDHNAKNKCGDNNSLVDSNDDNSLSNGSCQVLKRIKAEISNGKNGDTNNNSNSSRSSVQGDHRGNRRKSDISIASSSSNLSSSSNAQRRNRDALKHTQIVSIQELAGLSSSNGGKNSKSKTSKFSRFKRKLRDTSLVPKRHNKVADWSVTISSVNSGTVYVQSKPPQEKTFGSILRTSKNHIPSTASINGSPSVRFAEGTVFQDPNQVRRRKVPRLQGRKSKRSKPYSSYPRRQRSIKIIMSEDSYDEETKMALSIVDKGVSCMTIAPLVDAMACF